MTSNKNNYNLLLFFIKLTNSSRKMDAAVQLIQNKTQNIKITPNQYTSDQETDRTEI